jgi:GPH family glycoside/pentoside/hexuronide:cation symporter
MVIAADSDLSAGVEPAATDAETGGTQTRDISYFLIIGWGIGMAAMTFFMFANTLVLPYLVDYAGVPVALAGILISASKIYDAVADPLIGVVSDRTNSRWGRRRPYLFWGSIGFFISWMLVFNIPHGLSGYALSGYCLMVLLFFSTVYGIFSVPYNAMPAEMTDHYHTRTVLMSARAIAQTVGFSAVGYMAPVLIGYFGGGSAGHGSMSVVLGIMTMILGLICFFMTSRAKSYAPDRADDIGFRAQVSLMLRNKYFFLLLLSYVFLMAAVAMMNASAIFYTRRIIHASDSRVGLLFATLSIGTFISLPFWVWASGKLGKRATYILGTLALAACEMTWYLAKPDEPVFLFVLRNIATGISSGAVQMMGQSMLPDTIEFDRRTTGLRREGVYAALYTTSEKVSMAIGVTIIGLVLSLTGYIPTPGEEVVQPASAIAGIYASFALLPAIFLVISGGVIFFYRLDEKTLKSATLSADRQ